MKSPIPWMGSKRRVASQILARIPAHTCYVEAFAGSASILFAREERSTAEVLNDLDGELVNFFRVAKHHLEEFLRQFKWALSSRKLFEWAKATPPETLTDIQRAARFFYLQRLSFGAKTTGQTFGYSLSGPPRFNLVRIEEAMSEVHLRLADVVLESVTWQDCLRRYDRPDTFFFLDPPYFETAGYGSGGPWKAETYEELAAAIAGLKGKALLTINDHPRMRATFEAFSYEAFELRYTVGGGGRAKEKSRELLFRSWAA